MDVFGATRSRVRSNYALITPDTYVHSPLLGWENATAYFHITPEMGARFTQYTAVLAAGSKSGQPHESVERLIYVLEGGVSVDCPSEGKGTSLTTGGYAFFPAGTKHLLTATAASRLIVFEKVYRPLKDSAAPRVIMGNEADVEAKAFLGDDGARLKTLLPIEPAFDLAVNIFTYQPGATLPCVEIHVMEHGLQMLAGAGVYRLGEDYYPVAAGDIIWMASHCPQWFVAMGKQPARYIYYKDIHRDGLEEKG
ncbi:(S)-ureidoglycine aminohydrolase [Anatilimnocola sp. NA78]|uniref:(S)-ureidoglycine aminohydrolase n=1 Tax=Anatilimnocola sp. NA78 TaxID=3415683 RepID=UPI003CE4E531